MESGWYTEKSAFWPGQSFGLEVEKVLFQGKSDFQDLIVFKSKTYGNVLVLDGAIQITERDEFSYQEMISHLPLFAHPNPKKVCVIGGGDGAVLSQILKHKSVEHVDLCEIDELVIIKSKEFFPQFAHVFDDPRVSVVVRDGIKYLKELPEPTYDVIIVDSSDPIGPASVLFERDFYETVHRALREGGIVSSQSESVWLHLDFIRDMVKFTRELYPTVEYAFTTIPTYPCGQIGLLLCSKGDTSKVPKRSVEEAFEGKHQNSLRYYHSEMHKAAFVLPKFAQAIFETKKE
jgi:spermidine synthase